MTTKHQKNACSKPPLTEFYRKEMTNTSPCSQQPMSGETTTINYSRRLKLKLELNQTPTSTPFLLIAHQPDACDACSSKLPAASTTPRPIIPP